MDGLYEVALRTAGVGIGATVFMDIVAAAQRALGVPSANYALVGRWLLHMRSGRFRHASIGAVPRAAGERLAGWVAHYVTGVAFAAVLVATAGPDWLAAPTTGPALVVGLATVALPFLVMQPAFGLGIAASQAPGPWRARARSVAAHLTFGIGLLAAGRASVWVAPL